MRTPVAGSSSTSLFKGFDFEPGFIYTLEVRLEDRGTEIQDVGRYAYHLVKSNREKESTR